MKEKIMKAYMEIMRRVYKADEVYRDQSGMYHLVWHM